MHGKKMAHQRDLPAGSGVLMDRSYYDFLSGVLWTAGRYFLPKPKTICPIKTRPALAVERQKSPGQPGQLSAGPASTEILPRRLAPGHIH